MLETRGLTKIFGTVVAVDKLSIKVEKGEIFGLLGTNGAGKTTTMKILACLLKPTYGTALVDGMDVTNAPLDVKARIGYLPEMPSLYEKLTGREFLMMVGTLRNMPDEVLESRVTEFTRSLELHEQLDMEIGTYSKGMRQRIAFASSVLHRPPVLILDEPTSGLDPRFAKIVKGWIKAYVANGNTILMSTHVTEIAAGLCDRIAIVHNGRIVGEGSPDALARNVGVETLEDAFVKLVEQDNAGPVNARQGG